MAKLNFDKRDATSMIPGAHFLFVFVAMGAASLGFLGYSAGTTIPNLVGITAATVGVFGTFALGWAFRRSRKRLDKFDKIGLATSGGVPGLMVVAPPVRDFILAEPYIGFVAALPVIGGYIVAVER